MRNNVKPEFFEPSSEKTTNNIFRKNTKGHAASFQEIIQLQKLMILEQFKILQILVYFIILGVKQSEIFWAWLRKDQKNQILKKQRKTRHQFQGINSTPKINGFRAVYFLCFQNDRILA